MLTKRHTCRCPWNFCVSAPDWGSPVFICGGDALVLTWSYDRHQWERERLSCVHLQGEFADVLLREEADSQGNVCMVPFVKEQANGMCGFEGQGGGCPWDRGQCDRRGRHRRGVSGVGFCFMIHAQITWVYSLWKCIQLCTLKIGTLLIKICTLFCTLYLNTNYKNKISEKKTSSRRTSVSHVSPAIHIAVGPWEVWRKWCCLYF